MGFHGVSIVMIVMGVPPRWFFQGKSLLKRMIRGYPHPETLCQGALWTAHFVARIRWAFPSALWSWAWGMGPWRLSRSMESAVLHRVSSTTKPPTCLTTEKDVQMCSMIHYILYMLKSWQATPRCRNAYCWSSLWKISGWNVVSKNEGVRKTKTKTHTHTFIHK